MSLFSTLRTSVSGMAAQSNALSTIGDNIANATTDGYKKASVEFSTLLGQSAASSYQSGGVGTVVRYGITEQGTPKSTTSATDLAINGNGFFVVSKNGEGSYLTRAGSFVPDSSGTLVNAAGYQLMGYPITSTGVGSTLSPVNISATELKAAPSTIGTLAANLPATEATGYSAKTSMTLYDNLGTADVVNIYLTKTGDGAWQAKAYLSSTDPANGGSGAPIGTVDLTFDPTTGKLASGSAASLSIAVPNGKTVPVDLTGMTQLSADFGLTTAPKTDGNAPSKFDHVKIANDGTVTAVYANGAQVQSFKIPLATVASPDNLSPLSGNVYEVSSGSGNLVLSTAGTSGAGSIASNSLEQSTVDLATELTDMIVAQRGYEANSKVLQAGFDLLGVLNRLTTN